jgi:hypothetical protein
VLTILHPGNAVEEFAELTVRDRLGCVLSDRAATFLDQSEGRVLVFQSF